MLGDKQVTIARMELRRVLVFGAHAAAFDVEAPKPNACEIITYVVLKGNSRMVRRESAQTNTSINGISPSVDAVVICNPLGG